MSSQSAKKNAREHLTEFLLTQHFDGKPYVYMGFALWLMTTKSPEFRGLFQKNDLQFRDYHRTIKGSSEAFPMRSTLNSTPRAR